ncbi:RHS repeat domain-containing protein [Pseudomonas sp. v388]|uniref:RHS repeat domain-containing protein n=1 Tax=Pseudomonas sp. v388 TaxID=2479849 RepID=UPI000F768137|nr:RHS repeat-associated core domain-containing protein [Pseudomonas sp. v388]
MTRHLIAPGFGQPQVDVRYTYPQNRNFLGFGLTIPWTDDGYDNLFKYLGEYEYHCNETLWIDGAPVRSIERTYNRFHLMNREVTTQNNCRQTVETTYNYQAGTPYELQPADCQMPRDITTSWSELDDATRYRSESVTSRYDTHGNLIEQTQANGVVEVNKWYAATGEDGCPPNPEGFVGHLKEKTIIPAAAQGKAPTLCTRFRYRALAALSDSGLNDWLTVESEILVQLGTTEQELQKTLNDYLDVPDDPFLHGRIARSTTTINGLSSYSDFDYSKVPSAPDGLPALQTTTTLSSSLDAESSTSLQQQSLLTGLPLLNETEGVRTQYTYDPLGRLMRETASPDTPFEASRHYEYILCSRIGEQAEHIQTSARQLKTRILLDGLGRRILEERDNVEAAVPERFKRIYSAIFNAWGVLEEETSYDWLDGGTRELAVTSRIEYDDWGQKKCSIGPDGVQSYTTTDPIGSPRSQGPILRSWQQNGEQPARISGLTETWLNRFAKPSHTHILDAAEQQLGTQTWLYDGLGRCVEHSDELDHVTTFEYDAWSRLISSELPDQSLVKREYALHSSAELPTALRASRDGVNFILVGQQQFDGLQRVKQMQTGSRIDHYEYEAGHNQVKTRTTAAGVPIDYQYNRALTDQPVSSTAPDELAIFDYDTTSARLTTASNEQGVREYDYDLANQLRAERWISGGQSWETQYDITVQGRLIERKEQIQSASAGLATRYNYDGIGRPESIEQGRLRAAFEYDGLGQLWRTTTNDLDAGTTLVTELEYDDQGHEKLRTLRADGHPVRAQAQHWRADGLLASRHLFEGKVSLLQETFGYDVRGRLTEHTCAGVTLPRDALGRTVVQQMFTFDAVDNISVSLTTFADGGWERAKFIYDADDPFQLTGITYTPARATPDPTFSYDLNGNQLQDELGRRLSYDSQNRLLAVETPAGQPVSEYRYDSHDHLVTSREGGAGETLRFYHEQLLTSSVQNGTATQYLHHDDRPLGQQQADDPSKTLLLLTDGNASVIGETRGNDLRTAVYSAYGERHGDQDLLTLLGFNGELRDAQSGWYLLGKGYRAYNPVLMRFHSPDALSPFGAGGLNPYTYCLGNPIALRDPTGNAAVGYTGRERRPDEGAVPNLSGGGGGAQAFAWIAVAAGVVATLIGVGSILASAGHSFPFSDALIKAGVVSETAGAATYIATAATGVSTAASTAYAIDPENEAAGMVALGAGALAIGASLLPSLPGVARGAFRAVTGMGASRVASPSGPFRNPLAYASRTRTISTQTPPIPNPKPVPRIAVTSTPIEPPPPLPAAGGPIVLPRIPQQGPRLDLSGIGSVKLKPVPRQAPSGQAPVLDQLVETVRHVESLGGAGVLGQNVIKRALVETQGITRSEILERAWIRLRR